MKNYMYVIFYYIQNTSHESQIKSQINHSSVQHRPGHALWVKTYEAEKESKQTQVTSKCLPRPPHDIASLFQLSISSLWRRYISKHSPPFVTYLKVLLVIIFETMLVSRFLGIFLFEGLWRWRFPFAIG